jgi:hypothetical protein
VTVDVVKSPRLSPRCTTPRSESELRTSREGKPIHNTHPQLALLAQLACCTQPQLTKNKSDLSTK